MTKDTLDTFFGNGQWVIAEDAIDTKRLNHIKWMHHVPMQVACMGDVPEKLSLEELFQEHVVRDQMPLVAAILGKIEHCQMASYAVELCTKVLNGETVWDGECNDQNEEEEDD